MAAADGPIIGSAALGVKPLQLSAISRISLRHLHLVMLRSVHMRTSRFMPVAIFAVVISALAGGLFGSTALAKQDQVQQQYKVFTSALAAVDREYVEDVPSDRLVYGAID